MFIDERLRVGFETIRNNTALKRFGTSTTILSVLRPFETTQL